MYICPFRQRQSYMVQWIWQASFHKLRNLETIFQFHCQKFSNEYQQNSENRTALCWVIAQRVMLISYLLHTNLHAPDFAHSRDLWWPEGGDCVINSAVRILLICRAHECRSMTEEFFLFRRLRGLQLPIIHTYTHTHIQGKRQTNIIIIIIIIIIYLVFQRSTKVDIELFNT